MTEAERELIEVLQNELPQDLTVDQIKRLREAMRYSDDVRQALLEEIRLEQGLATRYAPEFENSDEFADRIEQIANARSRMKWAKYSAWFILTLCAVILASVYYIPRHTENGGRNMAKEDGEGGAGGKLKQGDVDPNAKHVDVPKGVKDGQKGNDTKGKFDEAGMNGGGQKSVVSKDEENGLFKATELKVKPLLPAWMIYDMPSVRGDTRWMAELDSMIRPAGGSMKLNEREREYYLRGVFGVIPPDEKGRMVRFRFYDPKKLRFDFENDQEVVRVEMGQDRRLMGWVMRGAPKEAKQKKVQKGKPVQVVELPRRPRLPQGVDSRFLREHFRVRVDTRIDFNWGQDAAMPGMASDQFAVRWTGKLVVAKKGLYRFYATSDDGVRVYINGNRIADGWHDRAAEVSHGQAQLDAGLHDIVVEYYDSSSVSEIKLEWAGPGFGRQVIPGGAFRVSGVRGAARGLTGYYCWGREMRDDIRVSGSSATISHKTRGQYVSDDGLLWRWFRQGVMDFRYQDGHVIVACSDVELLRLPMASVPKRMWFAGETRLREAGVGYYPALKLKKDPFAVDATRRGDDQKPSARQWEVKAGDESKDFELERLAGGSIGLVRLKGEQWATATTRVSTVAGNTVVTLKVTDATVGTGIFIEHSVGVGSFVRMVVGERNGRFVVSEYHDHADYLRRRDEGGFVFEKDFWCRVVYAINRMSIQFSRDGVLWVPYGRHHVYEKTRVAPTRRLGIGLAKGKGDRRVKLERFHVRHLANIERMFDANLVAKIPPIDAGKDESRGWDEIWEEVRKRRPKDTSEAAWRLAFCGAIMARETPVGLRLAAVMEAFRSAVDVGVKPAKLAAAMMELPSRLEISGSREVVNSAERLRELFDLVGHYLWVNGERKLVGLLYASIFERECAREMAWHEYRLMAPVALTRMEFFRLLEAKDWEGLRRSVMRFNLLSTGQDRLWVDYSERTRLMRLAAYLQGEVGRHLQSTPKVLGILAVADADHPFVVDVDRETFNTVAELRAAVKQGAFGDACRILTRRSLPRGISPVDDEGMLLKSTLVMLRQMIDQYQPLRRKLHTDFSDVGMIRLRQALKRNDMNVLEAIAAQFHGTPAAVEARLRLADRDLSIGKFYSAAAGYKLVIDRGMGESKGEVEAKYRLAMAMTGEKVGKKAVGPVKMPGGVIEVDEFEKLLDKIVRRRGRSRSIKHSAPTKIPEAPGVMKRARMRDFVALRSEWDQRLGRKHRLRMAWSANEQWVVINRPGNLFVIDAEKRRLAWSKPYGFRKAPDYLPRASKPLIVGDRMFVSLYLNSQLTLACYELSKRRLIWQKAYDDWMAGDPVLVGSWLYVLSVRWQAGGYGQVLLRRVMPETGESVFASPVARVRMRDSLFDVGTPKVVGDALLFRTGDSLIQCDLLGQVRWIRKLAYIPSDLETRVGPERPLSELVVMDGKVYVTSPRMPQVWCVDIASGKVVWTYVRPGLRRIIGRVEQQLLISSEYGLESLDSATGKLKWHRRLSGLGDSVIRGKRGTLAVLTLDRMEKRKGSKRPAIFLTRQIEWVNMKTGEVVGRVGLEDHGKSTYNAGELITDGRAIFAVTNVSVKRTSKKTAPKIVAIESE